MYQNENKTCWKYLFHSSLSSPWASKLPNGAVCTLSFPTGPFEGTMAFLPRSPAPRPPRGKDDEARRPGGQELPPAQGEWQDGESARAPVVLGVVKACGRQPGKFRRTQPGTDYSEAPQKDTAGRGLTTIVSFCCLWGWEPGRCGAEMLPSGDGGKKSSGQWNLLFRDLQASLFIQSEMGSGGKWNLGRRKRATDEWVEKRKR